MPRAVHVHACCSVCMLCICGTSSEAAPRAHVPDHVGQIKPHAAVLQRCYTGFGIRGDEFGMIWALCALLGEAGGDEPVSAVLGVTRFPKHPGDKVHAYRSAE